MYQKPVLVKVEDKNILARVCARVCARIFS
jgi:hypothetical protein